MFWPPLNLAYTAYRLDILEIFNENYSNRPNAPIPQFNSAEVKKIFAIWINETLIFETSMLT